MTGSKMDEIREHIEAAASVISSLEDETISKCAQLIVQTYEKGGKVLLAGNGGSAADAQHIAGELLGRFKMEREPLAALSLSTDTSVLTALTNDYSGDIIFSRQVEALGVEGDLLIALSTSGSSKNILLACEKAKKLGMKVIGFTGSKPCELEGYADVLLRADSADTPRIQEAHITAAHIICFLVEKSIFGK